MRTSEGRISAGMRLSPSTEFKPGQHWREPQPFRAKDWLEREYVALMRSTGDIGAQFGVTQEAVCFWLRKHGIPRRTISQARAIKHWGQVGAANPMFGKFGHLNHNYIDGSSPERQRMYSRSEGKEFLRDALRIGGYCCARCAATQARKNPLHVHHLKPWEGNPSLRFDLSNVAVLCRKCHRHVHSNKNVTREFLHG